MEFGTGWYLRGSVNLMRDQAVALSTDVAPPLPTLSAGVELGAGYQLNRWFRTDWTVGTGQAQTFSQSGSKVTCPYAATGLTDPGAPAVMTPDGTLTLVPARPSRELGYLWDSLKETCRPDKTGRISKVDMLLNGYVDLGTWSGITPYVGAGIGVSAISAQTDLKYYKTSDNALYAPDLKPTGTFPHLWIDHYGNLISPQPSVAYDKQDWTRTVRKTFFRASWALMAGVAYDFGSNAKLDIGYRYLNSGTYTSVPSPVTGRSKVTPMKSQEIRVGWRYMID